MTDKLTFGAPLNINDTYFEEGDADLGFQVARLPEGGIELAIGARWNGYAHRLTAAEVRQLVEFLTAGKSQPAIPTSAPEDGLFAIEQPAGAAIPMTWVTYKLNEAGLAHQVLWRTSKAHAAHLALMTPGLHWGRVSADGMFIEVDR